MCKISVITPVYKVEKFLNKCVDSILAQTFNDFELFIVDDGSPDACGYIADEYAEKDSRVRVIHKENGGAPSARNAGILEAKGEYFYFPDSDDWLESNYLEKLYNCAVKTGASLVVSGFSMEYYEENKFQTYKLEPEERNFNTKTLLRNNLHNYFDNMMMAVPWNKLYKADYIRKNKILFPNLKWDDLHFNMDVVKDIDSVAICNSAGYHFFRSRQGSETTTVFDGMLYKKRKEQFEHILSVYNAWNITDEEIMSIIYGYYSARLVQCVQEIAISNSKEKKNLIKEILNDELCSIGIQKGKINSKLLAIAVIPLKVKSVFGCLLVGRCIGFVKNNMSSMFYKMKSKSVNKARAI